VSSCRYGVLARSRPCIRGVLRGDQAPDPRTLCRNSVHGQGVTSGPGTLHGRLGPSSSGRTGTLPHGGVDSVRRLFCQDLYGIDLGVLNAWGELNGERLVGHLHACDL